MPPSDVAEYNLSSSFALVVAFTDMAGQQSETSNFFLPSRLPTRGLLGYRAGFDNTLEGFRVHERLVGPVEWSAPVKIDGRDSRTKSVVGPQSSSFPMGSLTVRGNGAKKGDFHEDQPKSTAQNLDGLLLCGHIDRADETEDHCSPQDNATVPQKSSIEQPESTVQGWDSFLKQDNLTWAEEVEEELNAQSRVQGTDSPAENKAQNPAQKDCESGKPSQPNSNPGPGPNVKLTAETSLEEQPPDIVGPCDGDYHHLNFHGSPIEHRTATPPEVSLWMALCFDYGKKSDYDLRKWVIASQGGKLIDPVHYHGPKNLLELRGTALRDKVTGYADKVYDASGTWRYDCYSRDDNVPRGTWTVKHCYDGWNSPGPLKPYVIADNEWDVDAVKADGRYHPESTSDLDVVNDDGRCQPLRPFINSQYERFTGHGPSRLRIAENVDEAETEPEPEHATKYSTGKKQPEFIEGMHALGPRSEEAVEDENRYIYGDTPAEGRVTLICNDGEVTTGIHNAENSVLPDLSSASQSKDIFEEDDTIVPGRPRIRSSLPVPFQNENINPDDTLECQELSSGKIQPIEVNKGDTFEVLLRNQPVRDADPADGLEEPSGENEPATSGQYIEQSGQTLLDDIPEESPERPIMSDPFTTRDLGRSPHIRRPEDMFPSSPSASESSELDTDEEMTPYIDEEGREIDEDYYTRALKDICEEGNGAEGAEPTESFADVEKAGSKLSLLSQIPRPREPVAEDLPEIYRFPGVLEAIMATAAKHGGITKAPIEVQPILTNPLVYLPKAIMKGIIYGEAAHEQVLCSADSMPQALAVVGPIENHSNHGHGQHSSPVEELPPSETGAQSSPSSSNEEEEIMIASKMVKDPYDEFDSVEDILHHPLVLVFSVLLFVLFCF